MLDLSIGELNRIVGGELKLGLMPPLAGGMEPIRRIVVDSSDARPGDVYWALVDGRFDGARSAEEAFARGALGVVTSSRPIEPWAGKFVLKIADAGQGLRQLVDEIRLRHAGRRRKVLPFHPGDTTGMLAAMLRGGNVTVDDLLQHLKRPLARAAI